LSREQTAYVGDDIKVVVNVIDSTGAHAAATIDTTTTRLNGYSAAPTVNTIATGIYEIVFSGVTPAPAEGDRLICKVNGDISGTAWTTYGVPVVMVADERGTDNASTFDNTVDTVITDTASREASKADVSALATAASIAALNDFDPTADTVANVTTVGSVTNPVATDAASRTASQADVSLLATAADLAVVDGNVDAIKAKTDQLAFTVANQVDANSLTGGTSPADIYTYFTSGSNEDAFKADVSGLSTFDPASQSVTVGTNNDKTGYALSSAANDAIGAAFLAYTLTKGSPGTIERAFWQSLKATQLADGEVSGTPTASAFDTNLTAVTGAYDHLLLLFTSGSLAGEARPIDTYNSTNGRITLQEALTAAPSSSDEFIVVPDHSHPVSEIYEYFVSGSNEDAFKADVSALATQASVDTIDGIVDAIKVKTDELTFTVPGSVDATATVVGGDATAANQTTIISHLTDIKGGTFDDTTDSLEAIRDRGDIAWATAGTGIYSLTVTVKDVSDNLISGARVNIDGTASTLTSNSSGQVVFNLDAGSYTLVTSPPSGYQTPANVNVTVSSDDSSEIILTATSTTSDAGWLG
jgi:hypothetical protein